MMDSIFFNNLINFPDVDFDLWFILYFTSDVSCLGITGWYLGEGRVYATGVPYAGKNFKGGSYAF